MRPTLFVSRSWDLLNYLPPLMSTRKPFAGSCGRLSSQAIQEKTCLNRQRWLYCSDAGRELFAGDP